MRLWMDDAFRTYTDEQLLQLIAHKGSLQAAAADGNVTLVTEDADQPHADRRYTPNHGNNRRTLDDYLREG